MFEIAGSRDSGCQLYVASFMLWCFGDATHYIVFASFPGNFLGHILLTAQADCRGTSVAALIQFLKLLLKNNRKIVSKKTFEFKIR